MATGGIPEVSASSNNGAVEAALLLLMQVVQTLQQQQLTLGKTIEEFSVKVALGQPSSGDTQGTSEGECYSFVCIAMWNLL